MNSKLCCPVCCEEFGISQKKTPRLLKECGHTLCSSCLSQMIAQNPKIICPTCRIETMGKYLSDYPKNFAILELLSDSGQKNSGEQNDLNLHDKAEKGDQAKTETEVRKEKELEEQMRKQEEQERVELQKLGYILDEMTAETRKLESMEAALERERQDLTYRLRDLERKQMDVKQRREATQRDFEKIEERRREIEERKRMRENEHAKTKKNGRMLSEDQEEKRGLKVLQDNSEEEKARLEAQVKELEEDISKRKKTVEILDSELSKLREKKHECQTQKENIDMKIQDIILVCEKNRCEIQEMKHLLESMLESMFKNKESQTEAGSDEKVRSTEKRIMEGYENLKFLEAQLIELDKLSKLAAKKVIVIQEQIESVRREQDNVSEFIYEQEMQKKSLVEKINELSSKKEENQVKQKPLSSRADEEARDKLKIEEMKRKKEQQDREDQEAKLEAEIVAIRNMLKALEMELADINEMKNAQVAKGENFKRETSALKSAIETINGKIVGQREKLVSLCEDSGEKNEDNINQVKCQIMDLEGVLAKLMQEVTRIMKVCETNKKETFHFEDQIKNVEIRIKETRELLHNREMEKEKIRKTTQDTVKEELSAKESKAWKEKVEKENEKQEKEKERLTKEVNEKKRKKLEEEICRLTDQLEELQIVLSETLKVREKLESEMGEKNVAEIEVKFVGAHERLESLMIKRQTEGEKGVEEEINWAKTEIKNLELELENSWAQRTDKRMQMDRLAQKIETIQCEIEELSLVLEDTKLVKDSL